MTISEHHRQLNIELHTRDPGFGGGGHKWASRVASLARATRSMTVLDYGCGKGTLKPALELLMPSLSIYEYDPGILGKDDPPAPAHLVICTDVLEHVEPDQLDSVLCHLSDLTIKAALIAVACRPGKRGLADGRDEHLIVMDEKWWEARTNPFGFRRVDPLRKDKEYAAILMRR